MPHCYRRNITHVSPHGAWLLVSASTGSASGSLRVAVWRRLRGLGALYLQQSVCLLPDVPQVGASVENLRERVLREGGTMRVLPITVADAAAEADPVAVESMDVVYDDLDGVRVVEDVEDGSGSLSRRLETRSAVSPGR